MHQHAAPRHAINERRVVAIVALVQLINVLDFMMVMPLGPDFARDLAIDPAHLGYVGGSYTAAAAVSGLIGAQMLDRFDRRSALVVAMIGLGVGTLLGALSTGMTSMVSARIVAGAFGGPATSMALAIVADVVPTHRRGRALGVVMAGFSVASVLGLPAGLYLAEQGSWRTPFLTVAAAIALVTVFAAVSLPRLRGHLEHKTTTRFRDILADRDMRLALVTSGLMMLSIFLLVPSISPYLQHNLGYPRHHIDLLYMAGGVTALVVLQLAGRAADRTGVVPITLVGTALMTVAVTCGFAVSPPLLPIMLVFSMFMASGSLRGMSIQALATRLPAPDERARYMSLQSAVQHIAASLGAFAAAAILVSDRDGNLLHMPVVALLCIGLALCVPPLTIRIQRSVNQRAARGTPP
jgi:predicted MFS family arabinose efflux permease